jgi:hypothetical protein
MLLPDLPWSLDTDKLNRAATLVFSVGITSSTAFSALRASIALRAYSVFWARSRLYGSSVGFGFVD